MAALYETRPPYYFDTDTLTLAEGPKYKPASKLPRYIRPAETRPPKIATDSIIPFSRVKEAIRNSQLTPGGEGLLIEILSNGGIVNFGPGNPGVFYPTLKSEENLPLHAVAHHINEVSDHLHANKVDLLFIPKNSGVPIGRRCAKQAEIVPIFLDKLEPSDDGNLYPPGSFVIPSYTGEGERVMSPPTAVLEEAVFGIMESQLRKGQHVIIRQTAYDDMGDKWTMGEAIRKHSAEAIHAAVVKYLKENPVRQDVTVSTAWQPMAVTLAKYYTTPTDQVVRKIGALPLVGLPITEIDLERQAIGILGVKGALGFK